LLATNAIQLEPLCRAIPLLTTSDSRARMLLARSSILSLNILAGTRPRAHPVVRTTRHTRTVASLPTPPPLSNLATSTDAAAARDWLMRFRGCPIPRAAVDIAFSRSSGPGGQVCPTSPSCPLFAVLMGRNQNVNKVNTKATVRCALDSTWIPSWARDGLRESVCCGVSFGVNHSD
jgi:hypothetical protein